MASDLSKFSPLSFFFQCDLKPTTNLLKFHLPKLTIDLSVKIFPQDLRHMV